MDKETCDYTLIQEKTVVEEVEDKVEQISLADAKMIDPSYEIGDIVQSRLSPNLSDVSQHRMQRTCSSEDP